MYKLMMEKEEDRESFLPKYERDYGEHGPIAGEPPNQDHGQPKNKCRPPPDPANFEHNDDSPPFDHDNNADVKERGYTSAPGVDIELGDQPQSSKMEDIAGLPHGDDGMEEEEKLSQPSSFSSKDDGVHLPSFPDDEGGFMEAVEMPNTHLSEGNQFSMPKSLSSQPDKILPRPFEGNRSSKRVSRRPLNRNKLTRAKGMQYGRELQKLKREVASLKAKRERNTSAGLDGGNADKRGTTPWQIFIPVYDDLKMMLRDFTRVYLPQMTCWSITIAVGYICGRSDF